MSIQIKAALVIILVVFAATAVMLVSTQYFVASNLVEGILRVQSTNRELAHDLVRAKINSLKSSASTAAEQLLQSRTYEEMIERMESQLEEYPDFLALTVFSREGVVAGIGNPLAGDFWGEESSALAAAFEGKRMISTTYIEPAVNPPLVQYLCVPMGEDQVLTITLPGLLFSEFLSGYRLLYSGNIFILDRHGTIIAHRDIPRVLSRTNYIEQVKMDPAKRSISELTEQMISTESGGGAYSLNGVKRVCSYRRISDSATGWIVALTVPIEESLLSDVQHGLLHATIMFLILASLAAASFFGLVIRPFQKVEQQNRDLEALNNTIQMQTQFIQSEHGRIKTLLDATPLACRLWDQEFKTFECNHAAIKLFRLKNKQEAMNRFFDLLPEHQPDGSRSQERIIELLEQAFQGEKCTIEWMHQLLDGTLLPTEMTFVCVNYGDGNVVATYTRDLREHKKMMRALEQRDATLNAMNRMATIMLQTEIDHIEENLQHCLTMCGMAMDIDRISIWENGFHDGQLGHTLRYEWSRNTILPDDNTIIANIPYLASMPELETVLAKKECVHSLTRNMSPWSQDFLSRRGDLSVFIVPVFSQDQFWGFVGFGNCRQERLFTESEQAMLQSSGILIAYAVLRNDMMLRLHSTAKQLETALIDAQFANQAKSTFLAYISHEARTPLNAIIGLCGLTLKNNHLHKEVRENLEKIYAAGGQILNTVNDILDISKIEAGKFVLQPSEYALASLINDTVIQNILRIGSKPIEFILNIDENLPAHLLGDDLRIRQILNNLLSNAIKYTAAGIVTLTITCEREEEEKDAIWLTAIVRDTGLGVREEDVDKLFTDYSQVGQETRRHMEGTGLGLSITKRLAEMMDGTVDVKSEYGRGSVFTVKLRQHFVTDTVIGPEVVRNLQNFNNPRDAFGLDSRANWNSRIAHINLQYARVLVVDDNLTNLDVTQGMMHPYNMQIDCVTSGRQAIDVIREEKVKYNAIFMDHMMPGMSGIEATQEIRNIGTDYAKTIPVIALTADAVLGNEELFLSKGFQAFLPKPIEVARLDEILRLWVRDRKQEELLADPLLEAPSTYHGENRRSGRDRRTGHDRRLDVERRSRFDRRLLKEIAGLDVKKGVARFGDWKSFGDILYSFALHTRPLLEAIRNVSEQNLADYAVVVHGIKGSSRGICAEELAALALVMENAAKSGNLDLVHARHPEFLASAFKLVEDIEHILTNTNSKDNKPKKDKPDKKALEKLMIACENYDMDGVDAAMAAITAFDYESDEGLVAWLRENVEKTNLVQIKERLLPLIAQEEM
jgi:signal transduction histidine kinase/DNA-binding response OmpR family regulator